MLAVPCWTGRSSCYDRNTGMSIACLLLLLACYLFFPYCSWLLALAILFVFVSEDPISYVIFILILPLFEREYS